MRIIKTSIVINATPEQVWHVLADFERYPEWNPFITSIDGSLEAGARLRVQLRPPGKKAMKFRPILQIVKPNYRLQWLGTLAVKGLFDGQHSFSLTATKENKTLFEHTEHFSGLLVPVILFLAENATREGFELMNKALKCRVEKK